MAPEQRARIMTINRRVPTRSRTCTTARSTADGTRAPSPRGAATAVGLAMAMFVLGSTVAPPAEAAGIYRVENPDGTVTYTDRPQPGANSTPVKVETVNDYRPPRVPYEGSEADRAQAPSLGYDGIAVSSPANEQNFHSNEGNVPLTFTISPPLRAGDSVRVLVDGNAMAIGVGPDGLGQLTGIERGAHTLVVEVLDANKRPVLTSAPVTFFLHKTSVLIGPAARANGPARRPGGAVLTPPPPKKP
jgi:hypothetical protein